MHQETHDAWNHVIDAVQADYELQHGNWQAWFDDSAGRATEYQKRLADWIKAGRDPMSRPKPPLQLLEPPHPQLPPEPQPPTEPNAYQARITEQIETISTPTGDALIMPGRIILTDSDGVSFSVSEQELETMYTLAPEVEINPLLGTETTDA